MYTSTHNTPGLTPRPRSLFSTPSAPLFQRHIVTEVPVSRSRVTGTPWTENGRQVLQSVKVFDIKRSSKAVASDVISYARMDRQLKNVEETSPKDTSGSYDYFNLAKQTLTAVVQGFMKAVQWTDPVSYNFILASFAFSTSLVAVAAQNTTDPAYQQVHIECLLDKWTGEHSIDGTLGLFDLAGLQQTFEYSYDYLKAGVNSTTFDLFNSTMPMPLDFNAYSGSQEFLFNGTLSWTALNMAWLGICGIPQTSERFCRNTFFLPEYLPDNFTYPNQTCPPPATTGIVTTGFQTTGTTGGTTGFLTTGLGTTGESGVSSDTPSIWSPLVTGIVAGVAGLTVCVTVGLVTWYLRQRSRDNMGRPRDVELVSRQNLRDNYAIIPMPDEPVATDNYHRLPLPELSILKGNTKTFQSGGIFQIVKQVNSTYLSYLEQQYSVKQDAYGELLLGKGGFGTVDIARDLQSDHHVAIKTVKVKPNTEDEQETRNELTVLAEVPAHPNILKPVDSLEERKQDSVKFRIALPIAPYGSAEKLVTLLSTLRTQPEAEQHWLALLLLISHDLVNGVAHLHDYGVIQNDLKPANALIGEGGVLQVSDFGKALCCEGSMVLFPPRLGDVNYLGPEAIAYFRASYGASSSHSTRFLLPETVVGERCAMDMAALESWSLGMMLWELVNGAVPLKRPSAEELGQLRQRLPQCPEHSLSFAYKLNYWMPEFFHEQLQQCEYLRSVEAAEQFAVIRLIQGFLKLNPAERLSVREARVMTAEWNLPVAELRQLLVQLVKSK